MPQELKVLEFTGANVQDIPAGLRNLADSIEQGKFGDAHSLIWVIDVGGDIEVGMLGIQGQPGAEAHLLLGVAQHKIQKGCFA